jgi:hypothetical protein
MPITRKPKSVNGHLPEAKVNALIGKGGSPSRRSTDRPDQVDTPVIVRIPKAELMEVDQLVEQRPVKTPRHRWLLEAIHEKIVRERKELHA